MRSRPHALPRRALAGALLLAAACAGPRERLNVLLVTLDTTRADHLGCYGHDAVETPHIDGLAAAGTLYERCYTPVPITLPSHLSILTGTYPVYHGVHENAGFYVAPELVTLAEVLRGEGYATAAFVGAFPLDSQTGLDQGFDVYDDHYPSSLEEGKHPQLRGFFDERPAAEVVRPARRWIEELDGEPFFLWTHFFDPHQPWIAPSPYRERYAHAPYDGEIAAVDEAVGRLLAGLEERGFLDRTLVVLTADHGEGLGDHGELTHALLLFSSTVRVPLIVRDPRDPMARRVRRPVATVDILPTVLDRLGLEAPAAVQGDVLPRSDAEATPRRRIFSETLYGALLQGWSPLERLTVGDWMMIHGPTPKLFDLARDPGELRDLAAAEPERLDAMRRLLLRRKRDLAAGGLEVREASVSPAKRARLAALGYLGSGGTDPAELEVSSGLPDPHLAIAVFREMNEGKHLAERGEPGMAAAVLENVREADPGNAFVSQFLALAYLRLGDLAALEEELDHLLALDPDHLPGHLLAADLRRLQGDVEGAVDVLGRAVELDPRNRATRLLLAHHLEDLGRHGDAGEVYRALLELAPGDTLARNGYATLLYRQGRAAEAVGELEELRRAQPFYAPAALNLAVIRHDQGRIEDSEALARRALELRPAYGLAHELHALNLELLGDLDGAREAWRAAARFAAGTAARERAEQALAARDTAGAPPGVR